MDARLVASRMPGLAMYGAPYTAQPFPGYLPYGSPASDPSAFYGPVAGAGENAEAWRAGLTQAAAAAYYEPQLAAHYGYGYGPMGLADGARRKNATRETTSTLKAWLNEHRKNPYPTKGEKIMLAIITKMTLTQVSTWFANARRRLKKENKMTWSPRNRCGEDDDDDMMDDGEGNSDVNNSNSHNSSSERKTGETSENSRTSSPVAMTSGSEMPMFDMQHHPFINRPGCLRNEEDAKTSNEDEEIDLESLDEDKKDLIGKSEVNRRPPTDLPMHLRHQQMQHQTNGHPMQGKLSFGHHHPLGARGIPLPPHLMGGHQIPLPGNVPKPPQHHIKSSPSATHQDRKQSSSPASSTASLANSSSSPTKPKIWSLADVATSNDSPKNKEPSTSSAPPTTPPMPTPSSRNPNMLANPAFQQEAIRNWVDGVMQQQKQMAMAAAAMAGAHPHGFLPQGAPMMPQNFGGLNPAALAALSRGGAEHRNVENKRFHPYGFADFAAAQQRATLAAAHAASMSMHNSAPESPPATYTSTGTKISLIDSARSEKLTSPFASSPVSSTHQTDNNTFPSPRPASNDSGIASAEVGKESKHSPK